MSPVNFMIHIDQCVLYQDDMCQFPWRDKSGFVLFWYEVKRNEKNKKLFFLSIMSYYKFIIDTLPEHVRSSVVLLMNVSTCRYGDGILIWIIPLHLLCYLIWRLLISMLISTFENKWFDPGTFRNSLTCSFDIPCLI